LGAHEPLPPEQDLLGLHTVGREPVVIDSAELRLWRGRYFVRLASRDGVEGVTLGSERLIYLWPVMVERVLPFFVGRDARDVERLVDEVARHEANYKLAGLAFWSCVAAAEMAVFDLLGKTVGKSVGELLGGAFLGGGVRPEIPVYLSSMRRETTAEDEVALLAPRLAATGARAVKLKIGGRMGVFDAAPGRTEQLVAAARKAFGDDVSILVDGNGSYNDEQAVEIGQMLDAHGVHYFEEPCPWEDFEATKRIADRLDRVQVAGGEQDASFEKFQWMIRERGVDVVTPDLISNGGFVRTLRVVRLAAAAGLDVSCHSARNDFLSCAMLHMASATPGLVRPQEFLADEPRRENWYEPQFAVKNGCIAAPTGPGLGMTIDPGALRRAKGI
jgi:L-alanine-DL-glutamate epimerase-like enolase superfamily enzyme